jgi:hypothetical protein
MGSSSAFALGSAWFIAMLASLVLTASFSSAQNPSTVGQFSSVTKWPYEPIHAHLLPSGNVMFWTRGDNSQLWNPTTNVVTAAAQSGANIFCGGHAFLSDGRLLESGGHIVSFKGLSSAFIYNPSTDTWSQLPDMNAGRWYPTNTALPNGDMLVISGQIDTQQGMDPLPQVWQVASGSWRNLSSAQLSLPYYPFMFWAPQGKAFYAGPGQLTRYLAVSGTGAWSSVGNSKYGVRNWGSAVMYDTGKVLLMGGSTCAPYTTQCTTLPTATAEIISLINNNPAWNYTGSMAVARRLHTATLLPDGKVLVTGGTQGSEDPNSNSNNPAYAAEMWDPATGTWSTMASLSVYRGYHSIALLLPDGRVLSGGGDFGGASVEIYSPPYLFKGTRPTIASAPTSVSYGQTFFVGTPDATNISNVRLLGLGSVTHGFNMGQRITPLSFSLAASQGGLNLTAPANSNITPPGYYMLFIVNSSGIPSVATMIQVGGVAPTPTPTPTPTPSPTPTATPSATPTSTPVGPSNLAGTIVSSKKIQLSWIDNSNNESGFKIERSTDGTTFVLIATVGTNVTTYSNTGLTASTTYYYRVRAFNSVGKSAYSNTVNITLGVPAAPSNLIASATLAGEIDLSWTDNSNNEAQFKIERSTDLGLTFTQITTVGANVTSYRDIGLTPLTTYTYRVRASNVLGDSAYSNLATSVALPGD